MLKILCAGFLALASAVFPCSPSPMRYYVDTLSSTEVRVWREPGAVRPRDTVGIFKAGDFQSYLYDARQDSALIFIGVLDSVVVDDTSAASSTYKVLAHDPNGDTWVSLKVRVDTLISGVLPQKTFWVKARFSLIETTCGIGYARFLGIPFLNISTGLDRLADLKLSNSIFGNLASIPALASWFDGRYVVSPQFPGLRVDLFDTFDNGPTGVLRRGISLRPAARTGKSYQPDGRRVPENPVRKTPLPLLK
jgi:hypothetical protein